MDNLKGSTDDIKSLNRVSNIDRIQELFPRGYFIPIVGNDGTTVLIPSSLLQIASGIVPISIDFSDIFAFATTTAENGGANTLLVDSTNTGISFNVTQRDPQINKDNKLSIDTGGLVRRLHPKNFSYGAYLTINEIQDNTSLNVFSLPEFSLPAFLNMMVFNDGVLMEKVDVQSNIPSGSLKHYSIDSTDGISLDQSVDHHVIQIILVY